MKKGLFEIVAKKIVSALVECMDSAILSPASVKMTKISKFAPKI